MESETGSKDAVRGAGAGKAPGVHGSDVWEIHIYFDMIVKVVKNQVGWFPSKKLGESGIFLEI